MSSGMQNAQNFAAIISSMVLEPSFFDPFFMFSQFGAFYGSGYGLGHGLGPPWGPLGPQGPQNFINASRNHGRKHPNWKMSKTCKKTRPETPKLEHVKKMSKKEGSKTMLETTAVKF